MHYYALPLEIAEWKMQIHYDFIASVFDSGNGKEEYCCGNSA